MNTLTPNRILQKGDEYRDNGSWKPVPKDDFGLQIMFTKYAEVRRPSETISPRPTSKGEPSNDSHPAPTARKVQTSEGAKREASARTTPPSGSPSVDAGVVNPERAEKCAPRGGAILSEKEIEANGLPTVVSRKAHKVIHGLSGRRSEAIKSALGEKPVGEHPDVIAELKRMERERDRAIRAIAASPAPSYTEVAYPDSPHCIWIGRNGTFRQRGISMVNTGGIVRLMPIGARGRGKNAQIEIPPAAIPQMIEFLQRQVS